MSWWAWLWWRVVELDNLNGLFTKPGWLQHLSSLKDISTEETGKPGSADPGDSYLLGPPPLFFGHLRPLGFELQSSETLRTFMDILWLRVSHIYKGLIRTVTFRSSPLYYQRMMWTSRSGNPCCWLQELYTWSTNNILFLLHQDKNLFWACLTIGKVIRN